MSRFFKLLSADYLPCVRQYSLCCPPKQPPGNCGCPPPGGAGQRIAPPPECRPSNIPPNPCAPQFYTGKDIYKRYRAIALFFFFPIIAILSMTILTGGHHEKPPCVDYEYMRMRTKRFPWGDGSASLFHNPEVNYLPGECEPPPLECEE